MLGGPRFELSLHAKKPIKAPTLYSNPFLPHGVDSDNGDTSLAEPQSPQSPIERQETEEAELCKSVMSDPLHNLTNNSRNQTPVPCRSAEGLTSEHLGRTLEYFLLHRDVPVVIVSAMPPFHVQYANKAWSMACGWGAEEVIGCDCKFLQGEATDLWSIKKFIRTISDVHFAGHAQLDVLNYRKNGTLMNNKLLCVNVKNDNGISEWDCEEHFACISEVTDDFDSAARATLKSPRFNPLSELGMPIDRRDQCNTYAHFERHPAPKLGEWAKLSSKLDLSLAMQYMLETQAAAVLVDSDGKLIHMNKAFSQFMKCRMVDCEGINFESFIHDFTQPDQLDIFLRMLEEGNDRNPLEYANLVMDAGAANRIQIKKKPKKSKKSRKASLAPTTSMNMGMAAGMEASMGADFSAADLWLCALSTTKLSANLRLVLALWVSEKPISASKIALAPRMPRKHRISEQADLPPPFSTAMPPHPPAARAKNAPHKASVADSSRSSEGLKGRGCTASACLPSGQDATKPIQIEPETRYDDNDAGDHDDSKITAADREQKCHPEHEAITDDISPSPIMREGAIS